MQEKIDHNERQNGSNEPGLLGVRQYRPMKTDAAKWANSSLASSSVAWHPNCPGAGLLGAGIFRIYEEREETFEGRILN
jgi:hypothetical protein